MKKSMKFFYEQLKFDTGDKSNNIKPHHFLLFKELKYVFVRVLLQIYFLLVVLLCLQAGMTSNFVPQRRACNHCIVQQDYFFQYIL